MVTAFSDAKHWSDQIADILANGYGTPDYMRTVLARDWQQYTLHDMLLIIHWFFKGVTCEGEHTLEYRMRFLRHAERIERN